MPQSYLPYLSILGNILLVLSSLPQIKKIIVTKRSNDISSLTWFIILLANLCILLYAILRNDTLTAVLFTIFVIENLVMLYLIIKFKSKSPDFDLSPREDKNEKKISETEQKDEITKTEEEKITQPQPSEDQSVKTIESKNFEEKKQPQADHDTENLSE